MRVDASQYNNEAALHALGAQAIADVRDEKGSLIAYDLTPDVDLTEYEAAVAKLANVVPASVSKAQAKIQLLRSPGPKEGETLLDAVKAAVGAAGGEVQIWFEDAQTWERQNPYVLQLGGSLNLSEEQIDDLFTAAAKIEA